LRHLVVALKIMANASWTSLFVLPLLRLLTIEAFGGTGERTRIKISNGTRADEASRGVHTAQTENQSNEKTTDHRIQGVPTNLAHLFTVQQQNTETLQQVKFKISPKISTRNWSAAFVHL
jgi:hypothetical protein